MAGNCSEFGLVPHVAAKPTLAGVRAGRDEVLDRGVEVITVPTPVHREP